MPLTKRKKQNNIKQSIQLQYQKCMNRIKPKQKSKTQRKKKNKKDKKQQIFFPQNEQLSFETIDKQIKSKQTLRHNQSQIQKMQQNAQTFQQIPQESRLLKINEQKTSLQEINIQIEDNFEDNNSVFLDKIQNENIFVDKKVCQDRLSLDNKVNVQKDIRMSLNHHEKLKRFKNKIKKCIKENQQIDIMKFLREEKENIKSTGIFKKVQQLDKSVLITMAQQDSTLQQNKQSKNSTKFIKLPALQLKSSPQIQNNKIPKLLMHSLRQKSSYRKIQPNILQSSMLSIHSHRVIQKIHEINIKPKTFRKYTNFNKY